MCTLLNSSTACLNIYIDLSTFCLLLCRPIMCTTPLDFGDTEVETLVDHFRPVLETNGIHAEKVMDQWTVLKSLMYQEPQFLSHPHVSWATVNRRHQHCCPDLLAVIYLVLSLPASTADCDRGFSTMKMVKSDWRSSLLSDTVRPSDNSTLLPRHKRL